MSESDSGRDSPYVDYRPKPTYKHPKLIDDDKNTRLHYAAAKNDVDGIANYLKTKSSIVDPENYLGWTPLMMACRKGHMESVKILLSHRANATINNRMGMNVFQIAIASGNLDMVEYLLEHFLTGGISKRVLEFNFSNVSLAVLFRHRSVLEFLIKKEFALNKQETITGVTPLMFAQAIQNDTAISILLQNKADYKLKNFLGHTAADIATIRQQIKFIDTNEHKALLAQKLAAANHEQTQNELQNHQLRTMLQLNKPNSTAAVVQQACTPSPHQVPCIVLSPYPNSPFVNYLQIPSHHQMLCRRSSNIDSASFLIPPPVPNVTPISPISNAHQGQVFFPPTFSPSQTPVSINTQMFNSMISQSHNATDLLNSRLNSSAGMFLSSPVYNFLSPCM